MNRLAVVLAVAAASVLWTCHTAQGSVDVRQPPSILVSPPSTIIYRTDQDIKLECSASGMPTPKYEWRKNDASLNLNLPHIRVLNDGDIELKGAGLFDEGYYQCVATNQHGTALSSTIFLQKAFQQEPQVSTVHEKVVMEGQPFHIDFIPLNSYPNPQFRWASADRSGLTDTSQTDLVKSKRMQWAENGNLYFSYALPEDELGERIYKGLVFNPYMDVIAGACHAKVKVERVAVKQQFIPSILFSSPNETVGLEGGNITLRCFFAGYPDPTIRWSGPNNVLPVGRFSHDPFKVEFKISNLRQSDAGEYTCTGSNARGDISKKIKLIVDAVPKFNDSFPCPRNMNVTEGDSVTFQCDSYAKPKAKVVWMINGEPVDKEQPRQRVSIGNDGHSLTVRSVCRDCSDLMVIQCNASNKYGSAFGAGYLNVLKRTEAVLATDSRFIVEDSSQRSVQFQCLPNSDPSTPVRITWYRLTENDDERFVVYSESPVVVVDDGTLTITAGSNVSDWVKHGGRYKCVADNGYSRSEQLVEIEVKIIDPVIVPTKGSILDYWWIFVIIACFLLLLILLLVCCICILRNRGDKYDVDGKERNNGNDPEKELIASGFHDYQRKEIEPFKGSQNSLGSSARLFGGEEDASEVGDHSKFLENGSYHSLSYANTADRKKGRSEYI